MAIRKQKTKKSNEDGSMGLTGHLKELRNRILIILGSAILGFVVCFQFSAKIVDFLIEMALTNGYELVYLAPAELFMQYLKVGIIGAIVVMSPVIIYQIWGFLKPGLTKSEQKVLGPALIFGLFCFVIGAAFAYKIMLPFMLRFFFTINKSSEIKASISVENYLTFIMSSELTFGITFELPVVIGILTLFGLINPKLLRSVRKFAIVLIFVVSAIITPPDITSQIMVSIPMIFLFELSIWVSTILYNGKKKKEESAEDSGEGHEDSEEEGEEEDE
ncbi:MAG: twin-arginine translocase subunit TatC [Eubacteriales bacterium]|nr:twin-arginine translocase subunit TatC [Eubacteriales bacterium]